MDSAVEMYILAGVIGLVQGGIQALSRSMFSELIPAEKNAEFFGFYNVVGKAAAVFGPFLMGWVTLVSGNSRTGMLSILVLFFAGMIVFRKVGKAELDQDG
jgi:UMF1 family MFS transporter